MSKTKKIISVVLALTLVMTMATVAIVSASAADTVKVYFENSDWGAIYAYVWGGADGEALGAWPGSACADEGNGTWSIDIPADCSNVIFNNGGNGLQTNNMENPGQTMIAKLTGGTSAGDYQQVNDAVWEAYGAPETTAAPETTVPAPGTDPTSTEDVTTGTTPDAPATGGVVTYIYFVLGALVLAACAVVVLRKKANG